MAEHKIEYYSKVEDLTRLVMRYILDVADKLSATLFIDDRLEATVRFWMHGSCVGKTENGFPLNAATEFPHV